MSDKTFRPWDPDQQMLFPPSLLDFVPRGHLAHFIRDLVRNDLDLSALHARYTERRGQPPYHPALMTGLLLYAYSRGIYSSRRIERACEERVDFMALTGGEKPDHSTICQFRSDHADALSMLFVQVLALCREAGMVKLGHVALDGTKVKANASRHAAMSYARMKQREPELAKLVEEWMREAKSQDTEEDDEHGPGQRGDELPEHIREKVKKLLKMRESMAKLEAEALAEAQRVAQEREAREKEPGHKLKENTGHFPAEVSADTRYCSEANIGAIEDREIRGYIATGRQKHGTASATDHEKKRQGPRTKAMRTRLKRGGWRSRYRLRKHTVEPVFGQIKEARGFRRFLRRGLENVRGEWALICTAHNLLKLAAARLA